MNVKAKSGQTMLDIAVQEYGAWEAVLRLSKDNGRGITDVPPAGEELYLHDAIYHRVMQHHCKVNEISPATAIDATGVRLGIFTDEFTLQFS